MGAGGTGKMEWGWARALALEEEHTVFPLDPKCAVGKRVRAACMEAPALRQQQFALHVGRLQLRVGETGAWLGTCRG